MEEITKFQKIEKVYYCNILTLDRAVNQEMHLCKLVEELRKQVGVKQ